MQGVQRHRRLISGREFALLKAELAGIPVGKLRSRWPRFEPMERLVVFKLLSPRRAMELFESLGSDDRYFLLGGFPPGSIAPFLEDAPRRVRALFKPLPDRFYDRMLGVMTGAAEPVRS